MTEPQTLLHQEGGAPAEPEASAKEFNSSLTLQAPSKPFIRLRGVRVHNLKNIDVDIPLHTLTVISGVSGAGKSSLAFDTLFAEAYHRYLQSLSPNLRQYLDQVQKPDAERFDNLPPAIALSQRNVPQSPRATVGTMTEILDYLRLLFVRAGVLICKNCGHPVRPSTTADVVASVETFPDGTRFGVSFPRSISEEIPLADTLKELREEGFVRLQLHGQAVRFDDIKPEDLIGENKLWVLVDRLEAGKAALQRLTDSIDTAFRFGAGRMALFLDDKALPFDRRSICPVCDTEYPALEPALLDSDKELALAVTLAGINLPQVCSLELAEFRDWCERLVIPPALQKETGLLLGQILRRLQNLLRLGLGYLMLDRAANSLAPGEVQRLRLGTALVSDLANVLYVLDEPAAGLHASEIAPLLEVLYQLRDEGNTVVLVENNLEVLRGADHVIDLGPGAGEEGGRICYQGPPQEMASSADSVTARFLSGASQIAVPAKPQAADQGSLQVTAEGIHNFQKLTVGIPLGVLCVITGVNGAGKTTLLENVLFSHLSAAMHKKSKAAKPSGKVKIKGAELLGEVVFMDRRPLGRSLRSNPVTYIKAFDAIREEFAGVNEAKIRNFDAGAFSFNQPGGRCENCQGQGTVTVDMQFLADIGVVCPECQGRRYKKEVLEIKVRSLSIAEVLDLTAREAFRFFRAHPAIQRRLKPLLDVGLDYIRLGQATETLSGGEGQRLKLAGQLGSNRKPRCLFLLDEPSAGLHPADIARLLECFDRLLQTGHSVVVAENHPDFLQAADYVIELGPGAGKHGGQVVAAGTPEQVAENSGSKAPLQ